MQIAVTWLSLFFFLVMANPAGYYFLNDDFLHIPLAAEGHFRHGTLVRPLADLTLWLDYRVSGRNAYGYHLTNVLIHLVNTLLVWLLSRRLFRDYGDGKNVALKSWLAALFFLWYAFHSESVFWIIGRGGSLSTLFFLIACLCYLKRGAARGYFVFSLLAFCAGLFVYEAIWVFPVVALFFSAADVRQKKKEWKMEWGWLAWIFSLFLVYLIFRRLQSGSLVGEYEGGALMGAGYFRLFYNYNALLARSFIPPMAGGRWFAACYVMVMALLFSTLLFLVRRARVGASGAGGGQRAVLLWLLCGCFLIGLLPAISLGIDSHTTESERFIYLPSVFCVLLITEIISLLVADSRVMVFCMLTVILMHAYGLWQSSGDYRYAGRVARQSLAFVNDRDSGVLRAGGGERGGAVADSTGDGVIYAVDPPSQYRGALIFRYGFEPAFRWICAGTRYRKMLVIGKQTLVNRKDPLQCLQLDPGGELASRGIARRVDSVQGGLRIVVSDTSFLFIPGRDRLFFWTDSSLVKVVP